MGTLGERYGDILPHARDAAALRVVSDLETIYMHDSSPPADLGAALDRTIYAHMARAERAPSPLSRTRATTWIRQPIGILAALVAVLATVGGVYAAVTTLGDQTLLANNGTRQIAVADLGRSLNLSRRACGFTVTLNRVYADVQRIVIAYTVVGPVGRTFHIGTSASMGAVEPTLTTAYGEQFESGGVEVMGTVPEVAMGHDTGHFLSYGARAIWVQGVRRPYHPGLGPLALKLSIPAVQLEEYGRGPWPSAPACEAHDATTGDQKTGTRYRGVEAKGPFIFAMTAPVAPTRTIAVREVRRVGATTITLTGVEATPSNLRVFLHVSGGVASARVTDDVLFPGVLTLSDKSTGGCPPLNAVVDGGRPACQGALVPADHIFNPHLASNSYTLDIPVAAYGERGPATLMVYTRLVKVHEKRTRTSNGYTESYRPRYVDPLTFHITLGSPRSAVVAAPVVTPIVAYDARTPPTVRPRASVSGCPPRATIVSGLSTMATCQP